MVAAILNGTASHTLRFTPHVVHTVRRTRYVPRSPSELDAGDLFRCDEEMTVVAILNGTASHTLRFTPQRSPDVVG